MGLLDGKVAVVTGGGTGIGRAVSIGLAAAGAKVVVNDYGVSVDGMDPSSEPANQVVADIRKAGGQAVAAADSVATMAGGRAVVDLALKEFGDLHVLVCCAGILRERMIFNMSEEDWDAVIAVHLKGHFTVMQPATRHMRERRAGSIITFTSTAGLEGSPGQPNYSAAKEGIVGLTRSTALAMAKYGVRCNAISPTADTRMTQRLPGERRGAATATPPEAIAPVAAFLASDRAAHITGQVVGVRGSEVTRVLAPGAAADVSAPRRVDARGARRYLGSHARPGSAAAPRRDEDPLAAAHRLRARGQGRAAGPSAQLASASVIQPCRTKNFPSCLPSSSAMRRASASTSVRCSASACTPPLTATLEATPAAPRTAMPGPTIGPTPGVRARSALVSNSSASRGPWAVCSATWASALTSLWPAPKPIIVRRIRLPSSMERNWPVMASVPGGAT